MTLMQLKRVTPVFLLLVLLLLTALACNPGGGPGATATPTGTPQPVPTVPVTCEEAQDSIQQALDAYHAQYGNWPTADGEPGDIVWPKLVPDFMEYGPGNDNKCDWWVNSDPEGKVCLLHNC